MDELQILLRDNLDNAAYSECFFGARRDAQDEWDLQCGQILPWAASFIYTMDSTPTTSQTGSEHSSSHSSSLTASSFSSMDVSPSQLLDLSHLSASSYAGFLDIGSSVPTSSNCGDYIQTDNVGADYATFDYGTGLPTPFLHAESDLIVPPAASIDLQSGPTTMPWRLSLSDCALDALEPSHLLSPPAEARELDQTSVGITSEEMRSQEVAFGMLDMFKNTHCFHQERRQHGCASATKHARQRKSVKRHSTRTSSTNSISSTSNTTGIMRKSYKYPCMHRDCGNSFTRQADLDRHIDHVHTEDGKKQRFECDYADCARAKAPFHRKDHFRDHLRDQHKEDIPKRGSNANQAQAQTQTQTVQRDTTASSGKTANKESYPMDGLLGQLLVQDCRDCVIQSDWWRCSRCLKRVDVQVHGWTCPTCKGGIEPARHSF